MHTCTQPPHSMSSSKRTTCNKIKHMTHWLRQTSYFRHFIATEEVPAQVLSTYQICVVLFVMSQNFICGLKTKEIFLFFPHFLRVERILKQNSFSFNNIVSNLKVYDALRSHVVKFGSNRRIVRFFCVPLKKQH